MSIIHEKLYQSDHALKSANLDAPECYFYVNWLSALRESYAIRGKKKKLPSH